MIGNRLLHLATMYKLFSVVTVPPSSRNNSVIFLLYIFTWGTDSVIIVSSTLVASAPASPRLGLEMRRKDPRNLPSLPLSAFTPPNTGTSEQFPVSSSPSTVHPKSVVDGHVIAAGGNLSEWKKETGQSLGGRIGGVVLFLEGTQPADVERALAE